MQSLKKIHAWAQMQVPLSGLNVMVIHARCHTNIGKQTTLLDGVDAGPPKWRVLRRGLNGSVNEGMKDISNVKVHLKTHSGNVNIIYLRRSQVKIVQGRWPNLMSYPRVHTGKFE